MTVPEDTFFTPGWYHHRFSGVVAFYAAEPDTWLEGPYSTQEEAEQAAAQAQADFAVNALIARALGYRPEPGRGRLNSRKWERGQQDQPGYRSTSPGPIRYTHSLDECARACEELGYEWRAGNVLDAYVERPETEECAAVGRWAEGLTPAHAFAAALLKVLTVEGKV